MALQLYPALEAELKRLKPQYTGDSRVTMDSWVDDILRVIRGVAERFTSSVFERQAQRIAASTISMADADNAEQFTRSVNRAVGVDFNQIVEQRGIQDYLQASAADNVNLIKSIPQDYFRKVETIILDNMRAGYAPSVIAKEIQEHTGVTYRRAKLIARDQSAKISGDLTKQRNLAAGIEYFKWSNSKDERVGEDHKKAAERDVGFGPGIYRWDAPPKEGIPGHATRPNCRCVAISMIEGVNYFPKETA